MFELRRPSFGTTESAPFGVTAHFSKRRPGKKRAEHFQSRRNRMVNEQRRTLYDLLSDSSLSIGHEWWAQIVARDTFLTVVSGWMCLAPHLAAFDGNGGASVYWKAEPTVVNRGKNRRTSADAAGSGDRTGEQPPFRRRVDCPLCCTNAWTSAGIQRSMPAVVIPTGKTRRSQ
jgi:hypothetical protein